LLGRDLNPRPLGYEPTESGHQLPLETIRPAISLIFLPVVVSSGHPVLLPRVPKMSRGYGRTLRNGLSAAFLTCQLLPTVTPSAIAPLTLRHLHGEGLNSLTRRGGVCTAHIEDAEAGGDHREEVTGPPALTMPPDERVWLRSARQSSRRESRTRTTRVAGSGRLGLTRRSW
jgi:hypothetical protein